MLTTYSFIVYPCNGPNLWPLLQTPVMLPPVIRRAPGRPKKVRNKKNDESTKRSNLAKQPRSVVCKNCRTIGHNRRTCKGKTVANRTIPKGGNKVLLCCISAVNFIYDGFLLHSPFLSYLFYILTELEETITMSHPYCNKETKKWSKLKSDHICRTSRR